jgi:hypothetical protein
MKNYLQFRHVMYIFSREPLGVLEYWVPAGWPIWHAHISIVSPKFRENQLPATFPSTCVSFLISSRTPVMLEIRSNLKGGTTMNQEVLQDLINITSRRILALRRIPFARNLAHCYLRLKGSAEVRPYCNWCLRVRRRIFHPAGCSRHRRCQCLS